MDETSPSTNSMSLADYYTAIKSEHEANNAWSAEQAQKAMDYQTQMSNTAHQREVADLKAAGLNPVLSAGGSGASSGSGIQAQRGDENVTALYGLTKMALESAIEGSKAMNNVAHYVSGASGSLSDSGSSELGSTLLNVLADANYRLFGVKQDNFKAFLKSLGINDAVDLLNLVGTKTTSSLSKVAVNGTKYLNSKDRLANIIDDLHGRRPTVSGSSVGFTKYTNPYSKSVSSAAKYLRDSLKSAFGKKK